MKIFFLLSISILQVTNYLILCILYTYLAYLFVLQILLHLRSLGRHFQSSCYYQMKCHSRWPYSSDYNLICNSSVVPTTRSCTYISALWRNVIHRSYIDWYPNIYFLHSNFFRHLEYIYFHFFVNLGWIFPKSFILKTSLQITGLLASGSHCFSTWKHYRCGWM